MKKLFIVLIICLILGCTSCSKKLDIEDLWEENKDITIAAVEKVNIFSGEYKIITKGSATITEYEAFYTLFSNGVKKIIYCGDDEKGEYYAIAVQFKNATAANNYYTNNGQLTGYYTNNETVIRNNISGTDCFPIYVFLDGDCDYIDEYIVDISKQVLLTDTLKERTKVEVPSGIKKITGFFMTNNSVLTSLICNEELERIQACSFMCKNLKEVVLNSGLKYIGDYAFYGSSIENIIIPSSVEYIGLYAFSGVNIYCEAKTKPFFWADNFADETCTIHWGGTWKYENGKFITSLKDLK